MKNALRFVPLMTHLVVMDGTLALNFAMVCFKKQKQKDEE